MKIAAGLCAIILALPGCSDQTPASGGWREMKFVRAEIRRPAFGRGNYNGDSNRIAVSDPQTLKALVAFFPHVGAGRESYIAGHWLPNAEVQLFRDDGTSIKVDTFLDPETPVWDEGNGDWPLDSGFAPFIAKLLAEHGSDGSQPSQPSGR